MTLVQCDDCGEDISSEALLCPHCGKPLHARNLCGFEYRSARTVAGWPLVHIATGTDLQTGRKRVAKGIIAIGDMAVGVLAIGGLAVGGVAIGGGALGVIALGGCAIALGLAIGGGAIGLVALGGIAVGMIALGGGAIGYYALGGGAWGVHAFGGNLQDREAIDFFRGWLGRWWPFQP
jgi:hypothetical protein